MSDEHDNGKLKPAGQFDKVLERIQKREAGDPAMKVPGSPPNFGKDVFPHVLTFQGILSSIARVYRPSDEALRDSYANARFMRNDCSIMECLEQRKRSTALLDWHLEPEDSKSVAAQWVADQLTAIVNRIPRFMQYRDSLLDALWYGRTAIRHRYEWQVVDRRQRVCIANWQPIHGDKLVFRYDDGTGQHTAEEVGIRVGAGYAAQHPALKQWADPSKGEKIKPTDWGLAYFLDPWERDMLAIHKHQIEDGEYEDPENAGRIHGVGIRSRIYWCWFQKQEALAWLMEYLERSGFGIEIWYYPYGNPEAKAKTREAAEERIGQGRNIIMVPRPVGEQAMSYGVERIEPGMAGAGMLQDILTSYFGHQIKRYILGQTLTSEASNTGLGSNLGEIHLATYMDIIKYDALNLEETLTTELIDRLKMYNFPAYRDVRVMFKIKTESDRIEERLNAWRQAFDMGVKLKARDVYDMIGAAEPGPVDEALQSPAFAQQEQQLPATAFPAAVAPEGPSEAELPTQGVQVGETRNVGGKTYKLNQNHRLANYAKDGETITADDVVLDEEEAAFMRQLAKGREVESEHTDDPAVAEKIARDHIAEDAEYYDKLEEIEKYARQLGLFDEEDHPRADDGKFAETEGGGGTNTKAPPAKKTGETTARPKAAMSKLVARDSLDTVPEHIAAIRIPPAWTDVKVNPDPQGDLWVTGKDAKGREQRVYSNAHWTRAAQVKFARTSELIAKTETIRKQNVATMHGKDESTREAAAVMFLIQEMGVRPGSDRDTKAKTKAYGATTLLGRHVVADGSTVRLQFTGKKGVNIDLEVTNPDLAELLTSRKQAVGDEGRLFNVDDGALRKYSHTLNGGSFKPKDFRTARGTQLAIEEVQKMPDPPKDEKDYKKRVRAVAKIVAAALGNTPIVCLQSYIDPTVFSAWRIAG